MSHARFIAAFSPVYLAAALALACLNQPVAAGNKVDQSRAVDPTGVVRILNPRGEVEVRGWNRSEVRVEGELDDLAESLTFEADGDQTLIQVGLPNKNVNWGDGSDVEVYVPATCRLKIDGVSADIEVQGVTGPISIRTASGDVWVKGIGSHTRINTVSGDVEVNEGTGTLKVVTTSGDFTAEVAAKKVSVDTMSGEVDIELALFETLTMSSVSGSLEMEGGVDSAGRVTAKSVSGDIELRLFEPVNASIDARTISGHIDNDLTELEPRRLLTSQYVLESRSGDGSAEVRLRTVSGSIEIEQTDAD